MSGATPMQIVAALIFTADRRARLFLQQRPAGKAFEHLWEIPGGKPEPGEDHATALVRELREELGDGFRFLSMTPFVSVPVGQVEIHGRLHDIKMRCFLVEITGALTPKEGQGMGWFDQGDVNAMLIAGKLTPGTTALCELEARRIDAALFGGKLG